MKRARRFALDSTMLAKIDAMIASGRQELARNLPTLNTEDIHAREMNLADLESRRAEFLPPKRPGKYAARYG